MSTKARNYYPGLNHFAKELSAYFIYSNYCILSLKDQERTIVFTPRDIDDFEAWLKQHKIRKVKTNEL